MATITRNLFFGNGEGTARLDVVEGRWPTDAKGYVFIVGPDKRKPGGHWFAEQGLLCRIAMKPLADGRVEVSHRLVDTPMKRIHDALPQVFRRLVVLEVSPFGFSNLANTNVQALEGRLFIGYDVGRPLEVDPESMDFLTPIGANDEWEAVLPGLVDPLVQIAAHPAPSVDERALYFLNYVQIPVPGATRGSWLARFGVDGSFRRWKLAGMGRFDSIHDLKASRNHLVISDLPFVIEPGAFRGEPRTRAAQDFTQLYIVRKANLESARDGADVKVVRLQIPVGTGHLWVDEDDEDGRLTVYLQHIGAADLMLTCSPDERSHHDGRPMHPDYDGLPFLGLQPTIVGKYVIDASTGAILDSQRLFDAERFWGGVLTTQNLELESSRRRARNLFYGAIGYDPELIPETAYRLYHDFAHAVVPMDRLPQTYQPGSLTRIDLESMRIADSHTYGDGTFPHPPTFVPREGCKHDLDGYVVTVIHRDGDKELHVFDAANLSQGPIARATAKEWTPPLLLHSCHLDPSARRPSAHYRVSQARDAVALARHFGPARWKALAQWARRTRASSRR